jgi:serine protease Do
MTRRQNNYHAPDLFLSVWAVLGMLVLLYPAPPRGAVLGGESAVQDLPSSETKKTSVSSSRNSTTLSESDLKQVLQKPAPESISDLRAIETQLKKITNQIRRSTVGVRIGRAQGSGVIISKDGYVLTAAHVTGSPGRSVVLTLSDGRKLEAMTLGLNRSLDAALLKITETGDWPFAEKGDMKQVSIGTWCVAVGHPGGFDENRTPVLRLGRVIEKKNTWIQTDCTLVGGDSGGPLFDLQGRVIGINSRIGIPTNRNYHIPIAAYQQQDWDRLVASEEWGHQPEVKKRVPTPTTTILGVSGRDHEQGAQVDGAAEGGPAEKSGIQAGDIITRIDGARVRNFDVLAAYIQSKKTGDTVTLTVLRNGKTIEKTATLSTRVKQQNK